MKAVALIDGEHYAAVVRAALAELPYEFVGAHLLGGREKLRGGEEDYGVPLAPTLDEALRLGADVVVDLSDEPVLGPVERLRLAGRVLAHGLPYVGADFRFDPPALEPFPLPSLAIVGTGKRVGKTAVTAHAARLLAEERRVVVVAMGRGGPPEPEVIDVRPTVASLLELSRSGRHAASDHLETAALTGVTTVGCRRCGGGLAGAVSSSNVAAGARAAVALDPDLVLFDGSGSAIPPVAAGRRVLVVGGGGPPDVVGGYLNGYRAAISDLVVVTMAEEGSGWERVRDRFDGLPTVAVVLRPRPLEPVRGLRVAFFGTHADDRVRAHLADEHGAEVVHASSALADRGALREELARVDAEVFLVELKAAAIDLVAEAAAERGTEVVLAASDVVPLEGEPDLDAELRRLAAEAAA